MIYTFDEIRKTMVELGNGGYDMGMSGRNINRHVCDRAVDMMDDMLHALTVYEGMCGVLESRGMLPKTPEECAKFWNREKDITNTRLWE